MRPGHLTLRPGMPMAQLVPASVLLRKRGLTRMGFAQPSTKRDESSQREDDRHERYAQHLCNHLKLQAHFSPAHGATVHGRDGGTGPLCSAGPNQLGVAACRS
jgi:hypothetical protein